MASRMETLERRHVLRRLDGYLEELEDAQASGHTVIPAHIAERLRAEVPGLRPGLSIADTLDLVFRQQERHMANSGPRGEDGDRTSQMDESEARTLTARIKRRLHGDVSALLLEAHDRRAWTLLGYRTWKDYVHSEFGLSRRRSYELLDHAFVLKELKAAAGLCGIPHINPYTAARIKPHLEYISRTLREKADTLKPHDVGSVIKTALERSHLTVGPLAAHPPLSTASLVGSPGDFASRRTERLLDDGRASEGVVDLSALWTAIEFLAALPSARTVAAQTQFGDRDHLVALQRALCWLGEFADQMIDGARAAIA